MVATSCTVARCEVVANGGEVSQSPVDTASYLLVSIYHTLSLSKSSLQMVGLAARI